MFTILRCHQSTKSRKTHVNANLSHPKSFLKSVRLDKKIIDTVWTSQIIGDPRNAQKQKMSVGDLGV